jgi:hypothetical protein
MKTIIFILLFVFSFSSLADDVYRFGRLMVAVTEVDGITVNRGCSNKSCLAYKKYYEFKEKKVSLSDLDGGKNPKAVKCKTLMKGKVLIGQDEHKAEQSFCVFSDDSYLKLN